jgi:hypothetical protein
LIARELKKLFKTTDNIISLEFGDITDPKAIGARIIENSVTGSELENNNHGLEQTIAQSLSIDPDTMPGAPNVSDDTDDSLVTIPRSDFLWTFCA